MEAYIARQPVFDTRLEVYAQELLFHSEGEDDLLTDRDRECSSVIAQSLMPGFDRLTGGKLGLVSIPYGSLVREEVKLLPPKSTLLAIHESVDADDLVVRACQNLKGQGFRIALDNFHRNAQQYRLLDLADVVKVDVPATGLKECRRLVDFLRPRGTQLLAEHVETRELFEQTRELGYDYFQGYFFARPTIVKGRGLSGSKLSHLRLLVEIHKPELNLNALEEIIEHETTLCYKLLRYVNSAYFSVREEVHSIRQALMILGAREIKRWASVIALSGMAHEKPSELQAEALLRGRFCELLAEPTGQSARAGDLFFMGLFSLMDAMLDYPMDRVLSGLPLAKDVKQAMLCEPGRIRDVHNLAIAYIRGQWDLLREPVEHLGIEKRSLPGIYNDALDWCGQNAQSSPLREAA